LFSLWLTKPTHHTAIFFTYYFICQHSFSFHGLIALSIMLLHPFLSIFYIIDYHLHPSYCCILLCPFLQLINSSIYYSASFFNVHFYPGIISSSIMLLCPFIFILGEKAHLLSYFVLQPSFHLHRSHLTTFTSHLQRQNSLPLL